MSSMKQYGHYWIAASIAVTGTVWLFRPNDTRIMGEDYAAIFETCQNALVIPYLTGTQTPDWEEANRYYYTDHPSNSIYSTIRYTDILKIADRSRFTVARADGSIFWTTEELDADTVEVAVSHGSYSTTNSSGILVNVIDGGGYNVTNYTYTFSTNTFSDSFVTTSTRLWQTNSQFETINRTIAVNGSQGDYQTWAKTNLPLANLVYGRGAATGLTNSSGFQTSGSWWPFTRSYSYPWEQWNTGERSRVSIIRKAYDNVAWTNIFVSTNDLSFSAVAQQTGTNDPAWAGYSISSFMALDGTESVTFAYVRPADSANAIYIGAPLSAGYTMGYVTNDVRSVPSSQGYPLRIWRRGLEVNSDISYATVYGPRVFLGVNGTSSGTDPIDGNTMSGIDYVANWEVNYSNALSVVKFWVDNPAVSPIYVGISRTYPDYSKSNSAFVVTSNWAEMEAVSGTITSGKITTFTERDDQRITTNKLNAFAEVLTNLYRTVYIGSGSILTTTNKQRVAIQVATNWPSQFITDQAGDTPTYYTGYDRNTQIDEIISSQPVTNISNLGSSTLGTLETGLFKYYLKGVADVYTNDLGTFYSSVVDHGSGDSLLEIVKYSMFGCSVTYPSLWSITNGYVKRVQVYTAVECRPNADQYYFTGGYENELDTYSHNAGGEYWTPSNIGITWSNGVINSPSVTLAATRTTGVHRVYSAQNNFGCTDKAVFTRIYDVSNPTNAISFDLPAIQTSLPDFKSRFAYLDFKDSPSVERSEGWYYDHSIGWDIRISRVMIIVDWKLDEKLIY